MSNFIRSKPWKRVAKPSRGTVLIAALMIGTTVSAFLLGSTFGEEGGLGSLSFSSHVYDIVTEPSGDMAASEARAAADTAAAAASDAKAAATGLSVLSLLAGATSPGRGAEVSAEAAEDIFERMVIFTARLRIEVDDVDLAVREVRLMTEDFGGFVAGMSTSKSGWGVMTLRVPQVGFYEVIEEIESLGAVEEREVKGEDFTETYVDLEARLSNLEREEERLVEILDIARNVDEVLKVEFQLSRVRGEIESVTGEMKYLEGRVELATVTLTLVEERVEEMTVLPQVDWWEPVGAGLEALTTVAQGMLAMAVFIGPFLAVGFPAYRLYKRGFGSKDASTEGASQ